MEHYEIRGNSIAVRQLGDKSRQTIVLLHGFTGSTATWEETAELLKDDFHLVMADLTGHGETASPDDPSRYYMEEQVEDLHELFSRLGLSRFGLLGYSMGGRVALGYAASYPQKIAALILESSSPGLRTEEERSARREADGRLAERIMQEGIECFVDYWENIPLFATQQKLPQEKRASIRLERLHQKESGLANSLIGIGTGSQPSYWNSLSGLQLPVLLLTGELDTKFVSIAREMKEKLLNADHVTIPGAGHAIHVENPERFATMVKEYANEVLLGGGSI